MSGGAWIKAPAHIAPRWTAQRAADPRWPQRGVFESFFAGLALVLDAGKGAPNDVLEASFVTLEEDVEVGIVTGQGAAGIEQALEVVAGRLGGEFEDDFLAPDGPEAVETPGGGADFPDSGLLDGVARVDAQGVLADQFLEAFTRLVFEGGGSGEQIQRDRIHRATALACLGFGAAGACAVGAGSGLLSGSSREVRLRPQCTGPMDRDSGSLWLRC